MASSISKAYCITCNKGIGQFKCEGCSQAFCTKHVVEHRQVLNEKLDEIILGHDALQQAMNDNKSQCQSLMAYIEQWEQRSTDKIRQMAKEARKRVVQLADIHKRQTVSQELQHLTERIKKAREDDDFFEIDLQYWLSILEKLQGELKTASLSGEIKEDKRVPLIYQIQISSPSTKMISSETSNQNKSNHHPVEPNVVVSGERFDRCYGNAKIEDNGHLVTNGNDSFFGTEIRGKVEYSFGKHRLRLRIDNNPSKIWIFIGIISKVTLMGGNLFASSSTYGWGDYNDYFLAGQRQKSSGDVFCVHTQENDIIELILDCSNRTIRYTNERNQKSQELNIDMNKCSFPWQLYLSLGGRGDQIRLLSSIT